MCAGLQRVRVVLEGGSSHPVDSSDIAFRLAGIGAFRAAFQKAGAVVLEPHMTVEVRIPAEYQGSIMGDLNRRRGMILDSFTEVEDAVIRAQVRSPFAVARSSYLSPCVCARTSNPCTS